MIDMRFDSCATPQESQCEQGVQVKSTKVSTVQRSLDGSLLLSSSTQGHASSVALKRECDGQCGAEQEWIVERTKETSFTTATNTKVVHAVHASFALLERSGDG